MSYRITLAINLGGSKTGQTLRGQLLTTAGTTTGSAITTGFTEIGSGTYLFDYSSYPDNFRGGLSIYPAAGTYQTPYTLVSVNPEMAEYLDQRVSLLPSGINDYLQSLHGSGSWMGATASEINSYLQSIHGSGYWDSVASLSSLPQDIEQYFASVHGSGLWNLTASGVNSYLQSIHGSGMWDAIASVSSLPEDINNYLSSIHGSGSWEGGSSSSLGNYEVNIYTQDENSNAVGGAIVSIYPSGSNNLLGYLTSNASTGKTTFNLDSGQYKVNLFKYSSVIWNNPNYFTVNGSGQDFYYQGTSFSPTLPTASGLVRLYAYLVDLGLAVDDDAHLFVQMSGSASLDEYSLTTRPIRSIPDADGYVYADVVPSTNVVVKIPNARLDTYITSPASGMLNLATLL